MSVLSPSEFKKENQEAYLEDYLTFLEAKQTEVETVLKNAQAFLLPNSVIETIEKESKEIAKILTIISKCMKQIVVHSIRQLSLEELQSYFNFEDRKKKREDRKKSLCDENKKIEEECNSIVKTMINTLYENGRCKSFYDATDVDEFFAPNKSAEEYLKNCFLLEDLYSLQKDFEMAIIVECKVQKQEMLAEEVIEKSEEFIALIQKCQKILEYSKDAEKQLVSMLLSKDGIGSLFPTSFSNSTCFDIVDTMMNIKKTNTSFYQGLPVSLQDKLVMERFHGDVMKKLNETYHSFLNNEEVNNSDLNQVENGQLESKKSILSAMQKEWNDLTEEEKEENEFIVNKELMCSVLEDSISWGEDQIVLDDLNSAISKAIEKKEHMKEYIDNTYRSLMNKQENLEKANSILFHPDYHFFFQTVEMQNNRRIYDAMGVFATEKVIEPVMEAEKKRLQQIEIMVSVQRELESIEKQIKEKENNTSFLLKKLSKYNDVMKKLKDAYQITALNGFKKLRDNELFHVFIPQISMQSTMENVVCTLPEVVAEPLEYFYQVAGQEQTFFDLSTGIDSSIQNKFLARNSVFSSWDNYSEYLMRTQQSLVKKLFCFTQDENGYYHFELDENDRLSLVNLQKDIIAIMEAVYEDRKKYRDTLEKTNLSLDADKVAVLENILGKKVSLSRDNLIVYIENTQEEIKQLKRVLMENQDICEELRIELPLDSIDQNEESVEEDILNLHLEGVKTLEDAIAIQNLLVELNDYSVPSKTIKNLYLNKK